MNAFDRGWDDYYADRDNPFSRNSPEYNQWEKGYAAAYEKDNEDDCEEYDSSEYEEDYNY